MASIRQIAMDLTYRIAVTIKKNMETGKAGILWQYLPAVAECTQFYDSERNTVRTKSG